MTKLCGFIYISFLDHVPLKKIIKMVHVMNIECRCCFNLSTIMKVAEHRKSPCDKSNKCLLSVKTQFLISFLYSVNFTEHCFSLISFHLSLLLVVCRNQLTQSLLFAPSPLPSFTKCSIVQLEQFLKCQIKIHFQIQAKTNGGCQC